MKSKRTVRMILIVLGALVFVMTFQFGYKPLAESNTQLTDQKMTLQTEVNQLKILWAQKEKMKDEIAELDEKSEASLEGIPSFVSQEDQILYVQGLENDYFGVTAMSMSPNTEVYQFNVNFLNPVYAGQSVLNAQLTLNYTGTYDELKKICEQIRKNGNQETIQSIEMSYNEDTGKMTGTLVINQYSRIGDPSVTYTAPSIEKIQQGKKSVFGEVSTGSSKGTTDSNQNESNPDQPQLP